MRFVNAAMAGSEQDAMERSRDQTEPSGSSEKIDEEDCARQTPEVEVWVVCAREPRAS